ncbi:MAG: hypothetical protein ACRED4_01575 [Brevundimonas sp.]
MMKKAIGMATGVAMLTSSAIFPVTASAEIVPSSRVAPAQDYGDLAAGPYRRLVILNAMLSQVMVGRQQGLSTS